MDFKQQRVIYSHTRDFYINPNQAQLSKAIQGEVKKNRLHHRPGVPYGHEIAARAVTTEWRTTGGQCVVMRETPGSNPEENPIFDISLSQEIVRKRKKRANE